MVLICLIRVSVLFDVKYLTWIYLVRCILVINFKLTYYYFILKYYDSSAFTSSFDQGTLISHYIWVHFGAFLAWTVQCSIRTKAEMSQDPETVGILLVTITKVNVSCCLSPETIDNVYIWENKFAISAIFQIDIYTFGCSPKTNSVITVMIRY